MVPWLRLPAFTVGDMISVPGQGTKLNEIIEVAPHVRKYRDRVNQGGRAGNYCFKYKPVWIRYTSLDAQRSRSSDGLW